MRENTMFFFENTRYCLFLQGSDEGTLKMSLGHFGFIIVPVPCGTRIENIYVLVLAHNVLTSEHHNTLDVHQNKCHFRVPVCIEEPLFFHGNAFKNKTIFSSA